MKDYKVYIHKNNTNGKVYVGATCKMLKDRWRNGHGYKGHNQEFWNDIVKYGWDNFEHIVVATGLTKEEAYSMEISLIAEHNATDSSFGYNKQLGGKSGFRGIKMSAEQKARLSEYAKTRTGDKNPMWHKERPDLTKRNLESGTEILQFSKDGDFIASYPSKREASRATGVDRKTLNKHLENKFSHAGGFVWKLAKET